MKSQDIRAALSKAPELNIGSRTSAAEANAAFPKLASFNNGGVFVGRFSGRSPWERHPKGDELLHVLDGEIEVTVLDGARAVTVAVRSGSIFVVPRGLWHRQLPKPFVTLLSVTPKPTEVSSADDPRSHP